MGKPPLLSDTQRQLWQKVAVLLFELPAALETQLQYSAGMTHFEWSALALLAQAPAQTLQLSALARVAHSSLPRTSQVVTRLEKRGWVRRDPSPHDYRARLIVLTDLGRAELAAARPGHHQTIQALVFNGLDTTQVEHLDALCDRLLGNIDTYRDTAGT
ncbi:MarR family winged helix-turn-helix transcriptional regulator [Nocardia sp. CA-128927]|uniref:MarR family winged helix-turn-helix transcriptional regulator n=1 Tax=Nocardia sp. CA-128927 TaxID=3239975 RepID=UPI003D961029